MPLQARREQNGARNRTGLLITIAVLLAAVLLFFGVEAVFFYPDRNKPLTLEDARKTTNPVPDSPAVLAEAKALYTEHCAHCHGDTGDGEGPEAMMYDPSPANFTNADKMRNIRDGELFYKITEGRKPMPSFKKLLTDDQRWKLVRYIRTFAAKPADQKQE